MTFKTEYKGKPDRMVVTLTDSDATVMSEVAKEFFKQTDIGVEPDKLAKYLIMRRVNKMEVLEGQHGVEPTPKTIIKLTFSKEEMEAIDSYRAKLAELVGVDMERTKAVKSLLNKGQIALGLEPVFN